LIGPLVVVETHPIQYHAPVWRAVQQDHGIPVTVVYGSDFSVAGYRDPGFGATFSWDTDLLSGYESVFLERAIPGDCPSIGNLRTPGLSDILKHLRPGAVLLVGYRPRFHQVAAYHAFRASAPILFRGDVTDHTASARWPAVARDRVLRRFYRSCSTLLYLGQRSLMHYRRLGVPDDRLVFSPHCVDDSTFRPAEADRARLRAECRRELGLEPQQPVVLFSGKFVLAKRPDLVLRALARLDKEEDIGRLLALFVGQGALEPELRQLAERLGVRCHFAGFQNQSRLSPFLHASDLLVLPSQSGETWGLVVNEALLHGLPAVVSDAVGCAPDLVEPGMTGEIFVSGSGESLARAIATTVRSTRSPQARAACREKVAPYSVTAAAAGVAEAYRRVTSSAALTN
jgi:glycosyltransferase involved in cell wall biosynthesis